MRLEPSQAEQVRALLRDANQHLDQAQQLIRAQEIDHEALLTHSLAVLEHTFKAFLTWHSVPFDDDITLRKLGQRCASLNSVYATSAHLAPSLAELKNSLASKESLDINDREAIERGFYLARNAHHTTLASLPEVVQPSHPEQA